MHICIVSFMMLYFCFLGCSSGLWSLGLTGWLSGASAAQPSCRQHRIPPAPQHHHHCRRRHPGSAGWVGAHSPNTRSAAQMMSGFYWVDLKKDKFLFVCFLLQMLFRNECNIFILPFFHSSRSDGVREKRCDSDTELWRTVRLHPDGHAHSLQLFWLRHQQLHPASCCAQGLYRSSCLSSTDNLPSLNLWSLLLSYFYFYTI